MFKKIILSGLSASMLIAGNSVQDIELQHIQSVIPSSKIAKYQKSEIDGFYDVYFESGHMIYVNPYKELIFAGELVNKNGHSITAGKRARWQDELQEKQLKNTSADKLIKPAKKLIYGKGSQNGLSFVVFTDPECPYCKTVEEYFQTKNSTVYINFVPLDFHKKAREWSEINLSSKNFQKTFDEILKDKIPTDIKITKDAKKQLAEMEKLGAELKVTGTPKIYVIDEKNQKVVDVINGANIPKLESYFEEAKDVKK